MSAMEQVQEYAAQAVDGAANFARSTANATIWMGHKIEQGLELALPYMKEGANFVSRTYRENKDTAGVRYGAYAVAAIAVGYVAYRVIPKVTEYFSEKPNTYPAYTKYMESLELRETKRAAATTIQAAFRGASARQTITERAAATTIQAAFRGASARQAITERVKAAAASQSETRTMTYKAFRDLLSPKAKKEMFVQMEAAQRAAKHAATLNFFTEYAQKSGIFISDLV